MCFQPAHPTSFETILALSELPWFELRDGRLALADPSIGPICDVHTHLALGYLGRNRVPLEREGAPTRHYLRLDGPLDLGVYVNKNFRERDLKRMKRDLIFMSATPWGMRRTHTAPNLLREMDEMGVRASMLLPVELPRISHNAETYLEIAGRRPGLLGFGSVHPLDPDPRGRLERQKAMGARGVKIHPAAQMIAPDHPKAMEVYRICGELDLPVLWHCGPVGIEPKPGRRRSQVKHYWRPVRELPETTFVLGHSGALQMDLALDLCRIYPNAWLEISCQSVQNVRRILRDAPVERVMFGSDWPFYHQAIPLAKVLIATDDRPEDRARVLWENAARLFGLDLL